MADTEEERRFVGPRRGQIVFALLFLGVSLFLLSQIGEQTKWMNKVKFAAQPRLWPAIGLGGMVLFSALHLWKLPRKRMVREDWQEAKIWLVPLEFALWFLIYVWMTPIIGYLLSTILFTQVLVFRMGYRKRSYKIAGLGFAICVVVIFKSFLQVKIPGGAIYEYLPAALRNFLILNF